NDARAFATGLFGTKAAHTTLDYPHSNFPLHACPPGLFERRVTPGKTVADEQYRSLSGRHRVVEAADLIRPDLEILVASVGIVLQCEVGLREIRRQVEADRIVRREVVARIG